MQLSDLLRIARRRWRFLLALPLIFLAAAGAYVASVPTTYTAHTQLYVSMATGTSVNDSYQGGLAAQQRMASYSYIAGGTTVAERVVDDLGLRLSPAELQKKITVVLPPATTLLDISVSDSTPEGARILTDKVAAQFRQLVGEVETTVVGAAPAAQATVIEFAQTPTEPSSPDVVRILGTALLAGIALGCLAALVRDRLDGTVRTPEQVDAALSVPVLATIPGREPDTRRAIAQLRARLAFVRNGPNTATLMVTSFSSHSIPSIALRLGMALADSQRRVALIDADVSGHGASARLGMHGVQGVAEWVRSSGRSVDNYLHTVNGVKVVPLGAVDERTPALLGSERFVELVCVLQQRFDYVLVDVPPASTDSAATALSTRFDGTLAIVELGTTSLLQVRSAAERIGAGLIGAVAVAPSLPQETVVIAPPPHQAQHQQGQKSQAQMQQVQKPPLPRVPVWPAQPVQKPPAPPAPPVPLAQSVQKPPVQKPPVLPVQKQPMQLVENPPAQAEVPQKQQATEQQVQDQHAPQPDAPQPDASQAQEPHAQEPYAEAPQAREPQAQEPHAELPQAEERDQGSVQDSEADDGKRQLDDAGVPATP